MYKLIKNYLFIFLFNFTLFVVLFLGIQNSQIKGKVNYILGETVKLPIAFILGNSFIIGSLTGGLLVRPLISKNKG